MLGESRYSFFCSNNIFRTSVGLHAETVASQSEGVVDAAECVADECAQLGFVYAEARVDSDVEAAIVQAGHRHVLHCLQRAAAIAGHCASADVHPWHRWAVLLLHLRECCRCHAASRRLCLELVVGT